MCWGVEYLATVHTATVLVFVRWRIYQMFLPEFFCCSDTCSSELVVMGGFSFILVIWLFEPIKPSRIHIAASSRTDSGILTSCSLHRSGYANFNIKDVMM